MRKEYKRKAIILSLLTVFSSGTMFLSLTAAWFMSRTNANNDADGLKIGSTDIVQGVKFYQHKDTEEGVIDFYPTESSESVGDGRYKTDLGFYNLLENNYQTLMEITLTDNALNGNLSLDLIATTSATQSHLTANSTGAPDYPLSNEEGVNNSLSSIADFYVFYEKDITITSEKISLQKSSNENSKDQNNKTVSNFIAENDDIVASRKINLAHFNVGDIANNNEAKLYVMLDYNEENCAKMYGNNLGNPAIEEGHFTQEETGLPILKFAADFEFEFVLT